MARHPHDCGGPGACSACDDVTGGKAEDRATAGEGEQAPASDPRSKYGDLRDWNYPRGYGGL